MRVLLVNTRHYRGGGDSTYTFNLGEVLQVQGHRVAFFAMRDERNLPDPNADLFVSPIDFKKLNRHKSLLGGIKVLSRVIYSAEARRNFRRLVGRFHPDVVHLQNVHGHISPSILFETSRDRTPVLWTLHDYKLVCPNSHYLIDATGRICEACRGGRYYSPVLRKCKKGSAAASGMAALEAACHRIMRIRARVDRFLAPSAFLRDKLVGDGFSQEGVVHLPLCLTAREFDRDPRSSACHGPYVLFLGKVAPLKGVRTLLESCGRTPEVRVVMAGGLDPDFADEFAARRPRHVEYVGVKQGDELRDLLGDAMALVLPSIWYENQPFCILEAFARGKPVIASDLGGMSELVADGERGFLVPPGDAGALAEAMRRMLARPEEARRMGEKAYAYARATFHPDVHYRRLMDLYDEVIRERGGSAIEPDRT